MGWVFYLGAVNDERIANYWQQQMEECGGVGLYKNASGTCISVGLPSDN